MGLVLLILFTVFVLLGVIVGVEFGSSYGALGKWIGGLAGSIAGVVGAALTLFTAALIDDVFFRIRRWCGRILRFVKMGFAKGGDVTNPTRSLRMWSDE
jgi:hypothetical protein